MSLCCASAGTARATRATGAKARASDVGKLIHETPGNFRPVWQSAIECRLNPPVPGRSGSRSSDRVPVGVDQDLAAADMVGLTDEAFLLHPLDQACRAVVAD